MSIFNDALKKIAEQPILGFPVLLLTKLLHLKNVEERILKAQAERKYFRSQKFNKTVVRGPFKGLEYPSLKATGSVMAPKLLGSYESELFPVVEKLCSNNYDSILDIGCAEGYYAAGLSLRLPKAKMFAFDTDKKAIKMCGAMAEKNNISKRVSLRGFCSAEILASFNFGKRGLIICDCEGYEAKLFSKKNIINLRNVDILIELHDTPANPIKPLLLPLFEDSHDLLIISTQKKDPADFPELSKFSDLEQKLILSECRGTILEEPYMEWAYLAAKMQHLKN